MAHIDSRSALVILAAWLLVLCGCQDRLGSQDSQPKLIAEIDWDRSKDSWANYPPVSVRGPLMTHDSRRPYITTVTQALNKNVGGKQYFGMVVWHGPEAEASEPGPESLVFEIVARRLEGGAIDIYISCKVYCQLDIRNFGSGVLEHADTGRMIERPFVFAPGEYHVQAKMPSEAQS